MASAIDITAIRAFIVNEMERLDLSKRKLSMAAGIGQTAVRDLLERTDNPGVATLQKVAIALDVPLDTMLGARQVPLVGKVGAGGLVAYGAEDDDYEMVARPPNVLGSVIGLEVIGDSMMPKYEAGDIVYVSQDRFEEPAKHVGHYCAVRLADGGTYLKLLAAGTRPDRYTLRSLNAGDMVDVEVEWATPVLFIMPRLSR